MVEHVLLEASEPVTHVSRWVRPVSKSARISTQLRPLLPGRSFGLLIVPVRKPRPRGLGNSSVIVEVSLKKSTYEYAATVIPSSFAVAMTSTWSQYYRSFVPGRLSPYLSSSPPRKTTG